MNDDRESNSQKSDKQTPVTIAREFEMGLTSVVHSEVDDDHIAWLGLDMPDSKVNTLGTMMMRALDGALQDLASRSEPICGLIIYSCKEQQFIAGADIRELAQIESEAEAYAKSKLGQRIFGQIAALSCPTLAVINGPAMGGGTELALACTWRLMTDNPKVQIALPEVRLGIVPGWGGTQRLPHLIGFAAAVDMICTGRSMRGSKCQRLGLVDGIINGAFWREQSLTFLQQKIKKYKPRKPRAMPKLGVINFLLSKTALGRSLVVRKAEKQIGAASGTVYPAPLQALTVLRDTYANVGAKAASLGEVGDAGLEAEAKTFSILSQTQVSRYLVALFLNNEDAKKRFSEFTTLEITHAGVLGAGVMGGGIAWLLAQKSIVVRVKDINWSALTKAFQAAAVLGKALVKKRRLKKYEMNVIIHRLSGGLDDLGMRHAQVVIEAVVEQLEIKRSVLSASEKMLVADATLCSNTSSLCIADLAPALQDPSRLVGMHFFNPVDKMPLVEVIAGPESSEQHIARITQLAVRLGKTPVVVQDCPGFLVNRLLMPYMNEAVYCAQDGASIEQIDAIFKHFGMPMGPFLLADEVGIDVCAKVAHNLAEAYGERMTVAPFLEYLSSNLQLLGKKSGRGFYLHGSSSAKKKVHPILNKVVVKALNKQQSSAKTHQILSDEDIRDRCLLVMINEAARCLDEQIVRSPADLDLAMIMGTGFPPFKGGLLRYADALGGKEIVKRMQHLHSSFGQRFTLAPALLAFAEAGGFYPAAQRLAVADVSAEALSARTEAQPEAQPEMKSPEGSSDA